MGARKREEQNPADCWALEDLFASDEQWEKAVEEFPEKMRHFSGFAGHLGEDGETLLKAMQTLEWASPELPAPVEEQRKTRWDVFMSA